MHFHNPLHLHVHSCRESESRSGSRSPRSSPRTPLTPRTPRTPVTPNLSKTEKNYEGQIQCVGCDHVEILISRASEQRRNSQNVDPSVVLHHSFQELEACECQICRVFRQALILEELTFDGIEHLRKLQGEVLVRWREATTAEGARTVYLVVEIAGHPNHIGIVNCNSRNDISHLALSSDGLGSIAIEQAKEWLNTCRDKHIGSCDSLSWSGENPKLLIEIRSQDEICLRENCKGPYAALSYCWGNPKDLSPAQLKEVDNGKTLTTNLDRRLKPFSMKELPTTVRDALRMIYAMDVKYAWVDTLCILQDKPDGVGMMHKVYSNALFTLCACATTQATAKLLDRREAWSRRTEPCRLGGQWLTTPDMSLNELRLRSPLADRAWTLQEERLSPRMLYVSSSRMQWSCAESHPMEMKPTYGLKAAASRPIYAASDRNASMPIAQQFLLACYEGQADLHHFWADIVKSYAWRNMTNLKDRLTALSGLAAKYLNASRGDQYLAGLWAHHLAEGLAWKVSRPVRDAEKQNGMTWPSWSWAVLPLQTAIDTDAKSAAAPSFKRIADDDHPSVAVRSEDDAIKLGQEVTELLIQGRIRKLWSSSSHCIDWLSISRVVEGGEKFTFASFQEQEIHSVESGSGRVLVHEPRKKEVIGQLDFQRDVQRMLERRLNLWGLELGVSTMLLLERDGGEGWRRVGVAWNVREDFFTTAETDLLLLR